MAVGWGGADPVGVLDSDTYELGTAQKANADLTITHVRINPGSDPLTLSGRLGTIWSNGGQVLGQVALPDTVPAGWSAYELPTPVERTTGQGWVVSYGTGGNYAFLTHALDADVLSSDSQVTSLGFANAPGTVNGRFNVNPGEFPAVGNASHGFYGADVQYTLGIGGNTAPEVTELVVVADGATVTAAATVTDAESLVGATLRFDWGDLSTPSASTYPDTTESHTYAASGTYAVLVSVTDSDGLSGYRAAPITVVVPVGTVTGLNVTRILDAITSHAARLGPFERVQTHEPKTAPTEGMTGAVWVADVMPVPELSGLDSTTMRLGFTLRLYQNMIREPQDVIDTEMTDVVSLLLAAYNGDFTLGGLVHKVDLLGAHGQPLSVVSGYIPQDGKLLRAMSIYLPVIIADAFNQEE
jgi:hypothetical protein